MAEGRALLGKPVARALNEQTLERADAFAVKYGRKPRLAVVTVDDPAGESYLRTIRRTAGKVGCDVEEHQASPGISKDEYGELVRGLNGDDFVDGILLQTPFPEGISSGFAGNVLDASKDIDGITPHQAGLLFRNSRRALVPSTARAAMEMLDYYKIGLEGSEVVIIGRSLIAGKPAGLLALGRNATVTWCHSKTRSLPAVAKRADVLFVAMGRGKFVDDRFVKPGATVIDIGINVDEAGQLCGDVDTSKVISIAAAYTPVPGGVGPVTAACLYANLYDAAVMKVKRQ